MAEQYENRILKGDNLTILKILPDTFVNTCVTSPPYWGLRDYGVTGQLGLEKTPEQYVKKMVEVFHEVRRVLCDNGTLWLNLGDTYAASGFGAGGKSRPLREARVKPPKRGLPEGYKPKDLVGIPWRVAFALQADGWYLRSDIIWHKPNPMPESVIDRPTKAHEYIFLLSKCSKYYYDAESIMEDAITNENRPDGIVRDRELDYDSKQKKLRPSVKRGGFNGKTNTIPGREAFRAVREKRNKRSVWTVATHPYPEAHFAVFPERLIEPCIKAGSPQGGGHTRSVYGIRNNGGGRTKTGKKISRD